VGAIDLDVGRSGPSPSSPSGPPPAQPPPECRTKAWRAAMLASVPFDRLEDASFARRKGYGPTRASSPVPLHALVTTRVQTRRSILRDVYPARTMTLHPVELLRSSNNALP